MNKQRRNNYLHHKEYACQLIQQKIEKYNAYYGFSYNRIAIKNLKSRWGSCSSKRNLNFNYKIIYLPERIADYIIVHELCHLGELNHSGKFWKLVAQIFPDYRVLRSQLKKVRLEH